MKINSIIVAFGVFQRPDKQARLKVFEPGQDKQAVKFMQDLNFECAALKIVASSDAHDGGYVVEEFDPKPKANG